MCEHSNSVGGERGGGERGGGRERESDFSSLTGVLPTWEGKSQLRTRGEGTWSPLTCTCISPSREEVVCIVLNTVLLPAAVMWCDTARSQYSV